MSVVSLARRGGAILCLVTALAPSASAHELRPAYLELREHKAGEFSVRWKTPARDDARLALIPEISGAERITPVSTRMLSGAAVEEWTLRAPALRGQTLRIRGLERTFTDALVRIEFQDGSTYTQRLVPHRPSAVIPPRESPLAVARVYWALGVEHILAGVDHLLFVLALALISGFGWKLLKTVTVFTVAHSVTLSAATLGFVHVPQAPVEAVIALSIVFVAVEIVRGERGQVGLTARAPWVAAFSFGLLHGLGFAGGLSEAGLPAGHIPLALLFFSTGVESGHFLFVGALMALSRVIRPAPSMPPWIRHVPAYAIGSVAAFWLVQRVAAF